LNDQIKDGEVGRACEMYVGGEICLHGNLKKRDHLEDLGGDGKILLKWIISEWYRLAWTPFIWLTGNSGMPL